MKKLVLLVSLMLACSVCAFSQAKYVFYFIGDGMGANHIQLTEMYQAAIQGRYGIQPLAMSQLPVATIATHYSNNNDVTDSAASGTALASGEKTDNGRIGVDKDKKPLKLITEVAKANGKKVGVLSTTNINHATPAAFTAHQSSRAYYYEICQDQIANDFDFLGGAGIYNETKDKNKQDVPPIREEYKKAGYTICDIDEFNAGWQNMNKVLLLPSKEKGQSVVYAIDRLNNDPAKHLSFKQLVEAAVKVLSKDNKKGFFLMAEAGEIDHCCHSHDAAGAIQEVLDMDEGVKVALEFYKKYPKQTLIVVTADHETGGITLNPFDYHNLARLSNQKHSKNVLSSMIRKKIDEKQSALTWEETKEFLKENLGLWDKVQLKPEEEKRLVDMYDNTIAKRTTGSVKDLYSDNVAIVSAAVDLLNEKSNVHWGGSHTACYTPVFAIGVGSELFTHKTDNAEIPRLIKKAAGYKE